VLTEECKNRLANWKFDSAVSQLTNMASPYEHRLVTVLSRQFGNSGWFTGDIALLVQAALDTLNIGDE
jgi:hypothetical protein